MDTKELIFNMFKDEPVTLKKLKKLQRNII